MQQIWKSKAISNYALIINRKIQIAFKTPFSGVSALSCYECENCVSEHPAYLNEKVKECPDNSYVSCLKTESKFAHYTSKFARNEVKTARKSVLVYKTWLKFI